MKKQLTPLLIIGLASAGCGRTSSTGSSATSVLPTVAPVTTTVPATANPPTSSGPATTDGSSIDPAITDPSPEIPPPDTMVHPTNVTPPPPEEEDGVGADREPEINPDEMVEPGVVRLYVSNQSFAEPTVHLTVKIDGAVIADQDFAVETQHNWIVFDTPVLTPGTHELTADSSTGVSITETFTLPDDEARYIGVDYWYYPDDGEDRHITVEESDIPMMFA